MSIESFHSGGQKETIPEHVRSWAGRLTSIVRNALTGTVLTAGVVGGWHYAEERRSKEMQRWVDDGCPVRPDTASVDQLKHCIDLALKGCRQKSVFSGGLRLAETLERHDELAQLSEIALKRFHDDPVFCSQVLNQYLTDLIHPATALPLDYPFAPKPAVAKPELAVAKAMYFIEQAHERLSAEEISEDARKHWQELALTALQSVQVQADMGHISAEAMAPVVHAAKKVIPNDPYVQMLAAGG